MAKDLEIGCYIHIPFCKKICSYCDFCKLNYEENLADEYLDELEREIKNSYNGEVIDTLYIGGGTPSALTKNQLEYLFSIIEQNLQLKKDLEYTIECNFDSIDKEKIDLMKKHGINRISFGLESINAENLETLDRITDKKKAKEMVKYCKSIGINNINLDLMYAIPKESIEILKKDLKFVRELDPTHISTYSLIIEDHTKLGFRGTKYIDQELDR
ncbi:MAG: radical SAM protein, partial [Bacilli bacterium]|nr:radical SAM protein [Bacilli bacterium]